MPPLAAFVVFAFFSDSGVTVGGSNSSPFARKTRKTKYTKKFDETEKKPYGR
jgi:hypothetical protein